MKKIFKAGTIEDSFRGYYDAESWIREQGFHDGSMQRDCPIGISKEDWVGGCKWRYLTENDRNDLDGVMISNDYRNGDVTVVIFDEEDKRKLYI